MTQFGSFLPEDQFETPQDTQFGEYPLAPDETAMTNAGSYGFDPMAEPAPQQEDMARLEATKFPQAQISMPGLMSQEDFAQFQQGMQPPEQTFEPTRDPNLREDEYRFGPTTYGSNVDMLWDQASGADVARQEEAARERAIARGAPTLEELEQMAPRQTMTQAIQGMQDMESMQGVVRGSLMGIPLGYKNDPEAERVMERRNVARAMRTGEPLPELTTYFNEQKFPGEDSGFFKQAVEAWSRGGMAVLATPERLFVDMPAGSVAYFTDNQYGADRLRAAAESARFITMEGRGARNNGFVKQLALDAIETVPQLIAQFGAAALTGGASAGAQLAAFAATGAGQAAASQWNDSMRTSMEAGLSATAAAANANRDAATAFASTFATEAIVGKVLKPFGIGVSIDDMTTSAVRRAAGMTTQQAILRGAGRGMIAEGVQEFADQAVTDFAVNFYRMNEPEFRKFYEQNPDWVSDVFKNAAYAGLVGAIVGVPAGVITSVSSRNAAGATAEQIDRIAGRLPENSPVRRLMEQGDLRIDDVDTVMKFVARAHAKLAIDNATDNKQMRKLGAALNMDGIEDSVLSDIITKGNNDGSVTATLRGQTRGVGTFGSMQFVVTPAMAADELVRRNLAIGPTAEQGAAGPASVSSSEGTLVFRDGDETTQDAVDRFVNENPVLASRLANMESISRKMAESLQGPSQRAGAPGAFDLSSMQQRQELLGQIRDAVTRQQAEMDPRRLQERIDKQRRGAEAEIIAELNGLNQEEVARVAAGVSPRKARIVSQLMQQIEQEAAQPVSANLTAEQRIRQMEDRQFAEAIRAREPGRAATAAERAQATPEAIAARRARNAEAAVKEKFNRDMDAAVETAWQSRQREVYDDARGGFWGVSDPNEQTVLDYMTALELARFRDNPEIAGERDTLESEMRFMGATSQDIADVREAARRRAKQLEEDFRKTSREEAISILDEAEQQAKASDPNYVVTMPDAVNMLIDEANFDMLQDIANVIADGKSLGVMLGGAVQARSNTANQTASSTPNYAANAKLFGWNAQWGLAKVAQQQGIDLSTLNRKQYAEFAVKNGFRINDDQLRMAPSLRNATSMDEYQAMRKSMRAAASPQQQQADVAFNAFAEQIVKDAAASSQVAPGIRIRSGTATSQTWLFFKINSGAKTTGDTHKAYAGFSNVYQTLTPDRFMEFMKFLQSRGYNGDIKTVQDLDIVGSSISDQIVMHGETEADALLAQQLSKEFFGSEMNFSETGTDTDGKSYSQILSETIETGIAARLANPASATQASEGVEMPDAMAGSDIEAAERRIRGAIDNIRRTRSSVAREPARIPGIQEVRAERDAILFEEQQKIESEMTDLRKQKALAENERQPMLEEAWMTKPKGKKPPQRRKKRAPMTPEEQKIVDRIRQIDERLAELEKDQARILEQRGIVSQTMPEPEAVDATSTFPDQDTSSKRRKIEDARREIADMNDIPVDQVQMRYADGKTTLTKQEQRFANFGKKLGITVVFVKTPGRTRTAGAHKAGVVFLSSEDLGRPSDMFAIAIHETIHYLHHSNPELFKGLYSLLNRKVPKALRELRKTYTRRLDMYARMNAVRRAGLIMLNDENETSRDAILWIARNEQSPEADILRANMPDQLAAALDDQDLGSLAEPTNDTISTYRKAFKQRVASGMRAPLSESQLQQEEIANLAQMLMDGAYTTIVGEDGKINLEELRRLADTKPAIGRLSALASAIMDAFQAIPGVPKKARGLNDAQLALLRQFAENPGELASPRKRNAAQQLIAKALVQMMDARRGKIAAGGIDANPMPDAIAKARIPALDFALRAEEQEPADFALRRDVAAMDAEYLAAVERGDMETAQRMVDKAAKATGYRVGPVYHATPNQFREFSYEERPNAPTGDKTGFFFYRDKKDAENWASSLRWLDDNAKPLVVSAYLRMDNPRQGARISGKRGEAARSEMIAGGYDSAEQFGGKELVVFSPEQIKSAEPVTRDEAGNVIPLSRRFDATTADINFAIQVPSQAFEQRFANSKVRDKDGNLMPMFHGSPKTGFKVFRVDGVGAYGPGAYFSSDARNTASGYAESTSIPSIPNQSGVYPVFLNITNPLYSNRPIDVDLWKTNPLIKEFGLEKQLKTGMSQFAAWNMMLNQLYLVGKDNPEASSRFMDENDIQLEIRQSFIAMGFDGVIIPKNSLEFNGNEETWAVAWRQNQIKSAYNFVPSDDPRIDFALNVGDIVQPLGDSGNYRVERAETPTEAFQRLRSRGATSSEKQLAELLVGTPQSQSIPVYTLRDIQGEKILRPFHRSQRWDNPGVFLDFSDNLNTFNHEIMHGLTVNLIDAEIDAFNRYQQLTGLHVTNFRTASGWDYGQGIADLAKFTTNPALKELLWIYYGLGPGNGFLRSRRSIPSADADGMFGLRAAWEFKGIPALIQHDYAPDKNVAYGLSNIYEFIAQLANSPNFRSWLASKTVEDVQRGLTYGGMTRSPWVPNPQIRADSILSRLYTAIKALLGDLLSGFNVAGTGLPADSVLPLVATAIDQFAGISKTSLLETLSAGQREAHIADNAVVPNLVGESSNARRQAVEFALRPVPDAVRIAAGVEPAIELAGSRKFATIRDFKVALQENLREVAKKAGVTVHDRDNTAIDDYIKAVAVSDAKIALGMKNNAVGWYDEKVKKALAIMALVYPELKADKRAQFIMKMALAITSNQLEVTDNFNLAARAYEAYKQTGKLPTDIGQGNSKKVMNEALGRLNNMIDKHGLDWVMEFSNTMYTVKQIKAMTGKQVSGESVDQMVYGAAIFGPKIGNGFFANLNGKYEQLTMDRWFMRTWGRWTGMLIERNRELIASQRDEMRKTFTDLANNDPRSLEYVGSQIGEDLAKFASTKMSNERISEIAKKIARRSTRPEFRDAIENTPADTLRKQSNAHAKAIDGSIEAPKSSSMRNRIRRVMGTVLVELQKDNPELTMADLQAVYWYPEKRLYDASKVSEDSSMEYEQGGLPDYEQAAIQFAKSRNISEENINGAIKRVDGERSVVAAQRAARGRRTAARRGGAGAVEPERQGGPDSVSFSLRDDPSTYEPADAAEADTVVNMAIRSGGVRTEVEDRLGALGRAWMGTARQLSSRLNPRNVAVEESDDIEIVTQPADISPFWKFIAAPINLAIGSKNPEVISVVEDMINMDMERNLTTKSRQEEANAVWESIPPDERDSEEFSRYMDAYHPPETIDDNEEFASKSQAWRNALKWFKEREEIRRQEIIETKRESIAGMLKRDNSTRLVARAAQYGMEWEVVRNEAGRKMIKTADGMVTIQQARDMLVKKMIPDNWGRQYAHFFHWFNGDFKLVGYDADNNRTIIGSAITEPEAYEKLYAFKRANPGVYKKLVAEPAVRIDPDDAVRLSDAQRRRLEKMLADATGAYRDEVADAMRGIVGSKTSKRPFYAPLMERTGAGGYVTDFPTVWNMSERLHNRWRMGGDMVRQLTPRIESIRRNTPGWGDYLAESMRHTLFTAPTMTEAAIDSMIRAIPVFGKIVSPFPTRRWLGSIRALNYARQLLTVRQQVVNSFQPLQTIYPLLGENGMMEAVAFYNSEEGKAVLRKHGFFDGSARFREGDERVLGADIMDFVSTMNDKIYKQTNENFNPSSEARNQNFAFVAMYHHAKYRMGMDDAEAVRYGRVYGNVYTQFYYTKANIPWLLRGPIASTSLQYRRFAINSTGLLINEFQKGNYSGVARYMATMSMLGGLQASIGLSAASLIRSLYLGDKEGADDLNYKLRAWLKSELGSDRMADIAMMGLPAALGIDLSGSISIWQKPFGRNIYEKIGATVAGPTVNTAIQLMTNLTAETAVPMGAGERLARGLLDSSPAAQQITSLWKLFSGSNEEYDAKGRLKYKLDPQDQFLRTLAFRTVNESVWAMEYQRLRIIRNEVDRYANEAATYLAGGDAATAQKVLREFNSMYPMATMTMKDISRRAKNKLQSRQMPQLTRRIDVESGVVARRIADAEGLGE